MTLLGTVCALSLALSGASLSGTVVSPSGAPAAGVKVFAEPGMGGALMVSQADAAGAFRFDDVPTGPVGVFTAGDGQGFTGRHINLTVGQDLAGISLRVAEAAEVSGLISSAEGELLKGAQITRVALTGDSKVGIPLTKLVAHGFALPVTTDDGHFTVRNLPKGSTVALKAGHSGYAQEGAQDIRVGDGNVEIKLYRGVLIEGSVFNRAGQQPVANVAVLVRNAQPPHDTSVAETGARGQFSIRLKPGVYLYSATGAGIRSAGWEQMRVSGEDARQEIRVAVAGVGTVTGTFKDAITSAPISGVRVSLFANGVRADVQRTGPGGAYRFATAEGANAIRIESAPGYLPPPTPEIPFAVTAGQETQLAELWLAPLPRVALEVVNESGAPVPGALVQLLRPEQFGWQTADAKGRLNISLSSYPSGQRVLGIVESGADAASPSAAVFALEPNTGSVARVQLFPVATLRGRVVGDGGKPLAGVEVGGVFPGESEAEAPVLLWRLRTDAEGRFTWPALVAGVPQQIIARDDSGKVGTGTAINLAPGEQRDLGDISIQGGRAGTAFAGIEWEPRKLDALCGDAPDWRALKKEKVLAVYTQSASADAVAESLGAAMPMLTKLGIRPMVVTNGAYVCGDTTVPVFKADATTSPRTLLVGTGGVTLLDTIGLPPLAAIKGMGP